MVPKPKQSQDDGSVDSWLMSYADLITLLMCFFIIFVSVSEPRKERITALASGMGGKFGTVDLSTPFNGVIRALEGIIETHQVFSDMAVESSDKFVFVELASGVFFKPDSAELVDDKITLLQEVIVGLQKVDFLQYKITIESHTNDVATESGLYASNWELSSARSARMVRMFIEQGMNPRDLRAVGLADTEPRVPNLDVNGNPIPANRERNDRIVIKLERAS